MADTVERRMPARAVLLVVMGLLALAWLVGHAPKAHAQTFDNGDAVVDASGGDGGDATGGAGGRGGSGSLGNCSSNANDAEPGDADYVDCASGASGGDAG